MTAIFLLSLFVKKITIYQVVNKNPGWSVITDQLFNKNFFVRITYEKLYLPLGQLYLPSGQL